jgi:hypothetical protein
MEQKPAASRAPHPRATCHQALRFEEGDSAKSLRQTHSNRIHPGNLAIN